MKNRNVKGYPDTIYFFNLDEDIFNWCWDNDVKFMHLHSTVYGNGLKITDNREDKKLLFCITWLN